MEENKPKILDISPLNKGKRMLAFLADFFICFIMTFVLFNVLVVPVSKVITNENERHERSNNAAIRQFNILYDLNILHYENEEDKYEYTKNVESTIFMYLSYYSFLDNDELASHPLYGSRLENESLIAFYRDVRNDLNAYLTILHNFNVDHDYFLIEGDNISLKDNVKSEIRLSFFSPDDNSEFGKKALGELENFFINSYASVFEDIYKNDLVFNGISFLENKKIVDNYEKEYQLQLSISALIAYLLSIIISYLVIPLISKDNKTIAMMLMRIQRVGTNNLYLLRKIECVFSSIFYIAFDLPIVFFMPMTQVAFTYLFNIPLLSALLFIGLLLNIASLIVILISPFNRSIIDYLSRSALIRNEDLDAIYRSKGYDV